MRERKTAASAKLQELIDALEMQNDESSSFFCLDTGEVHVLPHELLQAAESESDIADLRGDYEVTTRKRKSNSPAVSSIAIDI